jgi:two-component system LytT family sensor kinase
MQGAAADRRVEIDGAPRPRRTSAPAIARRGAARPLRPATGRWQGALEIALVWSGVAFFVATQRYLRGPSLQPRLALPWGMALTASFMAAAIWAVMTPAVMRIARRLRPRRGRVLRTVPPLLAAGIAAALLHLVVTNLLWQLADAAEGSRDFFATFMATLSFGGAARLATFFGIAGVTWGIDDFHTYREKELQASELERALVGTQLEALKLRLHPTFLFNTLAAIPPLIRSEPRAAARTVVQLGDLLRLALDNEATELVPLKKELEYIRLYLQIEQTRLKDRLAIAFEIEEVALDAAVPSLLLLPLVEGAIASGHAGGARVGILARLEPDTLRLEVRAAPFDPARAPTPIDEAFIQKTKLRLDLLFPGLHAVAVSERPEGQTVLVTLPLSAAPAPGLAVEGAA